MSLTILEIEHADFETKSSFIINFRAWEDKDFFIAQEIFRAMVSAKYSTESSFGYNENYDDILVFDYPKNKKVSLKYTKFLNRNESQIEMFWKGKINENI